MRFAEQRLGVALSQMRSEQEQRRQMESTALELVQHLGQPPRETRHLRAFQRFILTIPETLHAEAVQRGTRLLQVQAPAVNLYQVLDHFDDGCALAPDQHRHASKEL
jgi:hypothetical protein